jgi:calcineurin-like phosphoesterase family protein
MRYFTSDLHFFHMLVYKKFRSKHGSLEGMHNNLIQEWNKTVKNKDIIYIIGDVSFGKFEETKALISKLKGRKFLIRGNHDERFTSKDFIDMGFEDVRDTYVLKRPNEKWILSHYPYSSPFRFFFHKWFGKRAEANYFKLYLSYKNYKLVHGHHHFGAVYKFDQVNVAWDVHRKILSEDEIATIFEKNDPSKFKRILNTIKACFW